MMVKGLITSEDSNEVIRDKLMRMCEFATKEPVIVVKANHDDLQGFRLQFLDGSSKLIVVMDGE